MTRRLVLGSGTVGRSVMASLSTWPGEVYTVVESGERASELRNDAVHATAGDLADPTLYPESVQSVFIACDDPVDVVRVTEAVRGRFPDAVVVVSLPEGHDDVRESVEALADEVIGASETVAQSALDVTTGDAGERLQRLRRVLRNLDGPLAVVSHDNPDPDAIGSALALTRIAQSVGVQADTCYYGEISHQENRALVNVLDLNLRNLGPEETLEEYGGIALVDHSRPGVNDGLPPDTVVDIVVDHHPPRAPIEGRYVDLRSAVGATSTLLADYLRRFDIEPNRAVATALLYGIRVDTNNFTREVSSADFEAAAFLLPYADLDTLDRVETPSMSPDVLETLASAIQNRVVRGGALVSGVGRIRDRDALAQAADKLLDMDEIRLTVIYGFTDGTVYVSARARGTHTDVGEMLRNALGPIGSAGGHVDMAGAQIPLGILGNVDENSAESLRRIVDEVVQDRVFETLESASSALRLESTSTDITFEVPFRQDSADSAEDSTAAKAARIADRLDTDDADERSTDGRDSAASDDAS